MESCQAHGGRYECSKILIFAWNHEFYHWQQILYNVFVKYIGQYVTGLVSAFLRKCLSNINVWIPIFHLSVVLSNKKWCSILKRLVPLKTETVLAFKQLWYFRMQWQLLLCKLPISLKKNWCSWESKVKQINHFYCFIKFILKMNFFFLTMLVKNKRPMVQFGALALTHA